MPAWPPAPLHQIAHALYSRETLDSFEATPPGNRCPFGHAHTQSYGVLREARYSKITEKMARKLAAALVVGKVWAFG